MATLFVHHKVKDYAVWRKDVDDLTAMRMGYGCTGHKVFQSPDDPNKVTIFTEWKNVDQAKTYTASNNLKDCIKNAGVTSQTDMIFLAEA